MMWDVIVNEAEDIVKENVEQWIKGKVENVVVYGGKWKGLIEDDVLGVRREQGLERDRVPFIITKVEGVGESIIGLGGNYFDNEMETRFEIDRDVFDMRGWKEVVFKGWDGKEYRYVFKESMFVNAGNVGVDELLSYLVDESRDNVVVWKSEESGKINFLFRDELYIYVERDNVFGIEGQSVEGHMNRYRGVIIGGMLTVNFGAESVRTRSEMKDLILRWIDDVRNDGCGYVGNNKVRVFLNSLARGRGDTDVVIGGGDMYRMLFMGGVDVNVMIEGVIREVVESGNVGIDVNFDGWYRVNI